MNTTEIFAYNKLSDLTGLINSQIKNFPGRQKNLRFIIPSRKDKNYRPELNNLTLWTWEEIYNDICSFGNIQRKRILSPPDHLLILNNIFNEVISERSEKIKQWPGIMRPGFIEILSSDIRELLNEAVRPSQLINNPESSDPAEFLLPEIYSRYLEYLNNYDLLDSAQIYTEAYNELLKTQAWGRDLIIIFTGFLSFTHGQLELLYALQDRCEKIIILKPETNLANFRDAHSQFNIAFTPEKSSGQIIEIPAAEPDLEPEVIARTLALWQQDKIILNSQKFSGFDSIAITINQGREDLFMQAFKRYKIPLSFQLGIPINTTLPGKILASIRHLYTRQFPTYETALLLTQECFAGVKFPVMKAYRAGYSGLENWEKFLSIGESFNTALLAIQSIKKFCGSLKLNQTPAGIMHAFRDFLTTPGLWLDRLTKIAGTPELDETTRQTASAIETISQKVLRLDELMPDLGRVQDTRIKGDESFDFLERWCRNTNTRAPLQISNSVRIFTGTPPVLSSFPVLIMTGVTQKTWSANITSSPLLGTEERRKLDENQAHLPTIQEKAIQKEALFRRLIQTGENFTIISRPELDDEGRPVSESQFMQRFLEDLPNWNRVKANPAKINILLNNDGYIFPEIDSDGKIKREIPVIHAQANAVGASDIKQLLLCPFLWYQERQAKLYAQNPDIVSPIEWGNMIHKFWQCVWLRYRENMNSSGQIFLNITKSEWENLLQVSENYQNFARLIKDFRLRRHLDGVKFRVDRLSLLQSAILESLHGAGYEHTKILLEEDAHLLAQIDGVKFLGQCDRIEFLRSPDSQEIAFIVDYKEGTSTNYESSVKIESYSWNSEQRKKFNTGLQLSCYAALFTRQYKCDLSGVYILGLNDGQIAGSFEESESKFFAQYTKEGKIKTHISERVDEGEYAMKCAAEILKTCKFEPEYNSDLCRFCHVKSLCRKGEFKGEKLFSDNNDTDESESESSSE